MQPFQCDLQPQLQEPHRSTHTGTTTRCKTHRRNNSRMKRPQPHPSHTRGTFHHRLQPLYMKNTRFRAPASSPKHSPCNIHAAIPMRSATTVFKWQPHSRTRGTVFACCTARWEARHGPIILLYYIPITGCRNHYCWLYQPLWLRVPLFIIHETPIISGYIPLLLVIHYHKPLVWGCPYLSSMISLLLMVISHYCWLLGVAVTFALDFYVSCALDVSCALKAKLAVTCALGRNTWGKGVINNIERCSRANIIDTLGSGWGGVGWVWWNNIVSSTRMMLKSKHHWPFRVWVGWGGVGVGMMAQHGKQYKSDVHNQTSLTLRVWVGLVWWNNMVSNTRMTFTSKHHWPFRVWVGWGMGGYDGTTW